MTLCPIALTAGCRKCPVLKVCPLKGIIGDFKEAEQAETKQQAGETKRDEK